MTDANRTMAVLRETIPAAPMRAPTTKSGGGWGFSAVGGGWGIGGETDTWATLSRMLGMPSNRVLSQFEAFRIAGVLACTDVIAQDIAKATLRMYRVSDDGSRKPVKPRDHWLAEMLAADPNDEHGWDEFTEMVIRQFAMSQNAYIVKGITRAGEVTELIPVMSQSVVIFVDVETGMKFYQVSRSTNFERAMLRNFPGVIPAENMIHIRGRMVDGLIGFSSLVAGSDAMQLSREIDGYQRRLYSDDGRQKGVVELPENAAFDNDSYARLNREMKEKWRRMRTENDPLILEGGAKFNAITMTAADADVAKVRDAQVLEIARLFRVPPHKIMHFDTSKYSNLDAQEKIYSSDTLFPTAKRVEKTLARALLSRKERTKFVLEYDRDEMAAIDTRTRATIAREGLVAGAMEIDEYRNAVGLPDMPNGTGKMRLIPVNVAVIDQSNRVVVQGASRAATPEGSAEPTPDDATDPAEPGENAENEAENGQNPPKNGKILAFGR